MMMQRREFLRFLAVTAAVAATPDQINALERLYTINAPAGITDELAAVDEVMVGGMAPRSLRVLLKFFKNDDQLALNFGMNAFGGVVRWVAVPDQKIIVARGMFHWTMDYYDERFASDRPLLEGHVSYINQDGERRTVDLNDLRLT